MFELVEQLAPNAVIKVIGVGGGGGNAVSHMVNSAIDGVEFVCANTDAQAMKSSGARTTLQLGETVTKGLGAGANPEIGRQAALEDRDRIVEVLDGADMVFITCRHGRRHRHRRGAGGGAAGQGEGHPDGGGGDQAVPVRGTPAHAGGTERHRGPVAASVDSLITVPNEKLLTVLGREVTLLNAFKAANDVLQGAVQGIADLITAPGPDQRRLCRRADRDERDGHGHDGHRHRAWRRPRAGGRRSGHQQSAAGGREPVRRLRHPGQRHRGSQPDHARIRRDRPRGARLRQRGCDRGASGTALDPDM